jgi:hypothetical protein
MLRRQLEIGKEMPEDLEGFAYVNIDNPMAAWNVVRSSLYSPSCLPQSEQPGALSFSMADLLRDGNAARAVAEFRLEDLRRRHFPDAVSRITGIFLFDDMYSAAQVWSGAWSGHFTSDYLTDVGVSAARSSRHDATWITMMRNNENILVNGWEAMAESYWSGEPASNQPIWERVIEGWITIWGVDLKTRALEEIRKYWPRSLPLLEISANSAAIGSLDGAVMPYAVRKDETLEIAYLLRMVDAEDPEFCDRLGNFLRTGGERVCRFGPPDGTVVTPNFSLYSFERQIEDISLVW